MHTPDRCGRQGRPPRGEPTSSFSDQAVDYAVVIGRPRSGSEGNEHAAAMQNWVSSAVATYSPGGVTFDLTELRYVW